jgi:hypothetical protein
MQTSDAINFFADRDFTDAQGYNILIEDLWNIHVIDKPPFEDQPEQAHVINVADMARPEVQAVIRFLEYQIQAVLFPVIRNLLTVNAQVERAGELFKDELDAADAATTH